MIIQIRGTSGSGKTTAMRAVMKALPALTRNELSPVLVSGRRNPLCYEDGGCICVIGSYESTCGGVDTIHGYEELIALVTEKAHQYHVLMEGLLLSEDVKQTLLMRDVEHTSPPNELRVIFLNTPLDVCLERVRKRRVDAGNDKPLNETNTRKRVETIQRARGRLEAAGVLCRTAACSQVPRLVMEWLRNA